MSGTQHQQCFAWELHGTQVQVRAVGGKDEWVRPSFAVGTLGEVLRDVGSFVEVRKWKVLERGKVRTVVGRYLTDCVSWMGRLGALGRVSEGIGRTLGGAWYILAPNAVLHPQFGPGVTMATDGIWVIVWSKPFVGADWMLVHRSNVIGPVTSTPTEVREWARDTKDSSDKAKNREHEVRESSKHAALRKKLLAEL